MSNSDRPLANILGQLSFSAGLPDRVLQQLAEGAVVEKHPPGSIVFREGSLNPNFYLVIRGRAALEMCVPARGCRRLLVLGPGDMMAWSAILGSARMTATAVALDELELVVAPAEHVERICEADHDVGYLLMQRIASALAKRLLATRLQLMDVYSHDSQDQPAAAGSGDDGP